MLRSKKNLPYPLEYEKDQNIKGTKETYGEWAGSKEGSLYTPQLPLQEVNGVNNEKRLRSVSTSSYCVQLTKTLTFEGHIFDQELAFHFLLLRTKNNKHK